LNQPKPRVALSIIRVTVQSGILFKWEEGNTYSPITLPDGKYLVISCNRAALPNRGNAKRRVALKSKTRL
jgi:hypothetical protein